jgi:hypothetical protein
MRPVRIHLSTYISAVSVFAFTVCVPIAASAQASSSAPAGDLGTGSPAYTTAAPSKLINSDIRNGILTVDGMVAKVKLNYDVKGEGYLYFLLPDKGTVVVSRSKMPGLTEQKNAFHDKSLTVNAGGHTIELSSANSILADSHGRNSAWVRLDTTYSGGSRFPMMGYGTFTSAPYAWPGAKKISPETASTEAAIAPPMPKTLLPKVETASSPAMKVAPGQDAKSQDGQRQAAPAINTQSGAGSN